jgi:hypothetical protein
MKIVDLNDPLERVLEVYAIYWISGIRYCYVIPADNYYGFMSVREDKCRIIDPLISGFVLRKSGAGDDMIVHWAAEKGDLLDKLIDPPDFEAVVELRRRLTEENPPV